MKDLFDCLEQVPKFLKNVLANYEMDDFTYETCSNLLIEVEVLGFTFDYGLDAIPHNLLEKL